MKKSIKIGTLNFTQTEMKFLNQLWREDYSDCASIEEVVRRIAFKGTLKAIRIKKAFNIYWKRRKAGKSSNQIIEELKKRKMEYESVKKHSEKENEASNADDTQTVKEE